MLERIAFEIEGRSNFIRVYSHLQLTVAAHSDQTEIKFVYSVQSEKKHGLLLLFLNFVIGLGWFSGQV
ncbi:MAG TPA: hypothetical protein DCY03_31880 [Planctomycetaceae bacterium]|nr:hypothetical protein [Planctomycetaceae bacterium]|tara:strand:+ start:2057 stop:2260 length:204 start_codon:yes stop_codon:yes gene_type:complete